MPSGNKRSILQFPFRCTYAKFGFPGVGNTPKPAYKREPGTSRYNDILQVKGAFPDFVKADQGNLSFGNGTRHFEGMVVDGCMQVLRSDTF